MRLTHRLRLVLALLAVLAGASPLQAATPARVLYARALAREDAVRAALNAPQPAAGALANARRVVKSYESIATRNPASGYADNALWQAARLATDVWAQSGLEQDRASAMSFYKRLVKGYPSSSLVKRASAELKRLSASRGAPQGPDERILRVPEPAPLAVRDVATDPPAREQAAAPKSGQRATIQDITRVAMPEGVRVTIAVDREVGFREERIGDPDRVFVDLRGAAPAAALRATQRFSDGAVRQIRFGARPDGSTRVVLEVDPDTRHSVYALYNPYRLVIDCERVGSTPPARMAAAAGAASPMRLPGTTPPVPPLAQAAEETVPAVSLATASPSSTTARAVNPPPSEDVKAVTAPPPAPLPSRNPGDGASGPALAGPPAENLQGRRFSLSRQLGLGVSRIVIDPGHGGHDPGAKVKGLSEADLVLDVALRLEQLLLKQPGVDVVLTRRSNVFIPLEERTAIANREGADLFLSIHANASRNTKASGVETYFLNFASNPQAEAVAARENAASGQTMHSLPEIVKAITLNNKLDESRDFAAMVQRSMIRRLQSGDPGVRDLGVKQAPFVVLIGAGMPSVLAEISFLTNPREARLLKGNAHRQRIAEALYEGISKYQRSLKNVRTVANQ